MRRFSLMVFVLVVVLLKANESYGVEAKRATSLEENDINSLIIDQTEAFSFSRIRDKGKGDYKVIQDCGQTIITVSTNGLVITGQREYQDNFEVEALIKFAGPVSKRGTKWVALLAGKNGKDAVGINVRANNETSLRWTLPHVLHTVRGKPRAISGNYTVKMTGVPGLTSPDWIRRRVEYDIASQKSTSQKWTSLKLQITDGVCTAYLDDRFLAEAPVDKLSGSIQLSLPNTSQLKSLTITPLTCRNDNFTPICLNGYLNTGDINNKQVTIISPDGSNRELVVNKVPFFMPRKNDKGNDHIDLEPSWLRVGSLQGSQSPRGRNNRWAGAFNRNPARIQLRIPNRRYCNLWFIAAADGVRNSISGFTAQFYRPDAGFPISVKGEVPVIGSKEVEVFPIPALFSKGGNTQLYLVKIPINPGDLAGFKDMEYLEVELTKRTQLYRCYPDPSYYSEHQAGLPSGVHIYAMTMEQAEITMEVTPDKFAHIWTAPEKPSYTVTLSNSLNRAENVSIQLKTISYNGDEKFVVQKKVRLGAGAKDHKINLKLNPKSFGHHNAELTITVGDKTWTEKFAFSYLHPDTRERGNWEEGRGPIFGYWDWGGAHYTHGGLNTLQVMTDAGAGSVNRSLAGSRYTEEERAYAEKRGMKTFFLSAPSGGSLLNYWDRRTKVKFDPKQPEKMAEKFLEIIKESAALNKDCLAVNTPEVEIFFAEPYVDQYSHASLPLYCGEPEYKMDENGQKRFETYLNKYLIFGNALRKEYPEIKQIFPWGSPLFVVPFLRHSKEARDLVDGLGFDTGFFERLPETQMHQCSLHLLWEFHQEWKRFKKEKPYLLSLEGPCIASTLPGALTYEESANHLLRTALIQIGYGINKQLGWPTPFSPGDYWGTQHYGGGLIERQPLNYPKPEYSVYATMTRQLNGMNFVKWLPTGSLTTYCLQFKHYKTGELLNVIWTIKGKRQVVLTSAIKDKISIYDTMDNKSVSEFAGTELTLNISDEPVFVRGVDEKGTVEVSGTPDHSDSLPSKHTFKLANLANGKWSISNKPDKDYEESHFPYIVRYPGKMTIKSSGEALAVHLDKQPKERKIMPFYTSLVPDAPITIPGKASHLGLWVTAKSDWGRVVYSLRDAKGERWLSVGKKDSWNSDDSHGFSKFCFDGRRYLKFDLPSNKPYDSYRENGTTWWGSYSKGDGIVDLPLKLEKIIVERRTHVMYVNSPELADEADVLLGDLLSEYESASDMTDEAIRISRLRMPLPKGMPAIANPIEEMNKIGLGEATVITGISHPDHYYDGTRFIITFNEVKGALGYDVWVSPYSDGRGAVRLGKNVKTSGVLISGIKPDTDFYAFVVYTDKDNKASKPSKPFKIHLKDLFGNK